MKFLSMLYQRITDFVAKLFSLNTVQFAVATVLVLLGKIPWYAWIISAAMLLGVRFLKALTGKGFQNGGNGNDESANPTQGIQG
jgi:hypothetical protein